MQFFKTILVLLLLVLVKAKLGAQCGTISFANPVVVNGNVTLEVRYNNPPTTIYNLDVTITLGSATYVSAVAVANFSAAASQTVPGGVRIIKTTLPTIPINTSGTFKLCDVIFSLPPGNSTDICLFTASGGVQRTPTITCSSLDLFTPCLNYTMPSVTVTGSVIKIPTSSSMNNVTVIITPSTGDPTYVQTSSQGTYSALMLPVPSFTAEASRDDASSQCGIGEYDITLTQRVILNYATFSQPYEPIAADVNRNGAISTSDLSKMRQIILGQSSFVKDWEFIPSSNYNGIAMPSNSLQVPSYNTLMQIGLIPTNTFYGIKYGDVDGSGSSCATASFAENTASKLFKLGKAQIQKDQTVLIPVYGKQFDQEMLFSLGLNFDADKIEVLGLVAGALPEFSDSCYALDQYNRGLVNVLWMNTKSKAGISVKSNEPLFYVRANLFNASTKISEKAVSLSYDRLQNLAFNAKDSRGEAIGLEYEEAEGGYNLFGLPNQPSRVLSEGIHPNPFRDKLSLNITTTATGQADLRLLSQDGRLLRTIKMEVVSGQNNISIDQLDDLPAGIILYQLVLSGKVISGKLIKE
ncbi:T9SS type A sorting domain-containing protein [Haliscomenobacter hydrossis]|uniref:Dockerin domain-containing protein n=1 Tax=Haliscomenobacter hydrossis (strain ATCC 27775 / DSM 1100 / LMG 10767 / O) TaxID=760192 RepID=F4KPG3_HALH1|nr:T9SS type A sorting domain-containing protein [Haliscomenobacter hydrossis]AEE49917.1 hypothetical protein Halhy_2032 [Haliscomenobacter hydrossis DSM 1100]